MGLIVISQPVETNRTCALSRTRTAAGFPARSRGGNGSGRWRRGFKPYCPAVVRATKTRIPFHQFAQLLINAYRTCAVLVRHLSGKATNQDLARNHRVQLFVQKVPLPRTQFERGVTIQSRRWETEHAEELTH